MVDTQNLVGQGAQLAMDQIWRTLLGNAFVNAKNSQPVSAGDVGDTAFTVGLNALPFGAGGGAVKGAQAVDRVAADKIVKKILENPDISIVAPREAMPQILSSRFKSQRELLSEQPGFDPTQFGKREAVEDYLMGYPPDFPVNQRPIYGAVANRTDLPQWLLEKTPGQSGDALRLFDPRTNRSAVFGDADAVISRVPANAVEGSFTIGDSWVPAVHQAINMSQLQSPRVRKDILKAIAEARSSKGKADFAVDGKLPYIEAQMAARKNPVEAIRRIDIPPSYRRVWEQASRQAPESYTAGGMRMLDPIIKQVPKVEKQLARKPDAETLRYQELLFNNPVRPQIPQKLLKELLGSEKRAIRGAKGKAV